MIPILGLVIGIAIGLVVSPEVPLWLQPYLPIAVIAALDAVFGATRAALEGIFNDRVFVISFLSNVVVAALIVFLGDQLGVSVGDLFLGSFIPGFMLAGLFILWVVYVAWRHPEQAPALPPEARALTGWPLVLKLLKSLVPPLVLVMLVLGTIFFGVATPTEAGAAGAAGATALAAINRRLNWRNLRDTMDSTVRLTSMVFIILVGATAFSMVFTALGGGRVVDEFLLNLPGGAVGFMFFTMLVIFLLGFFIDFIEITFIVVPLIAPIAERFFGADMMLWFGVVVAMNLQSSFLTPPFGFSLFYLKGVAPKGVTTGHIYKGIVPFVVIQVVALLVLVFFPGIVNLLPSLAR